jgi:hypothetical protein
MAAEMPVEVFTICSLLFEIRFMVATRNLKAGELIFREKALVCGPKEGSIPLCLTCYSPLGQYVRCTECNIPFCSARCENVSKWMSCLSCCFYNLLSISRILHTLLSARFCHQQKIELKLQISRTYTDFTTAWCHYVAFFWVNISHKNTRQ